MLVRLHCADESLHTLKTYPKRPLMELVSLYLLFLRRQPKSWTPFPPLVLILSRLNSVGRYSMYWICQDRKV